MSDKERVGAFLRDLTELTHKHGIIIGVDEVGLEKTPVVSFINHEDRCLSYGTDESDRLTLSAQP